MNIVTIDVKKKKNGDITIRVPAAFAKRAGLEPGFAADLILEQDIAEYDAKLMDFTDDARIGGFLVRF